MSASVLGRTRVFPVVLGAAALGAVCLVSAWRTAQARPASSAPPAKGSMPKAPRSGSAPPSKGTRKAPRTGSAPPAPSTPAKRRSTAPFWLDTPGGGRAIVYPPLHAGRQPLAVMLHGMCDVPDNECPWLAPAVTPHAWLVCPRASLPCRGGGAMWSVSRRKRTVESAVEQLVAARPGQVDTTHATLMGFSQGAYSAFSIARSDPGQWSRLLLIAAKVHPNVWRLRHDGVKRMLLAAGDYDMTHGPMWSTARRLSRDGFPARFMSLGKVGHTFPSDMTKRMTKAMAWLKL